MLQRILIADDNPTFRQALRHLLEGVEPWEIIEAQDGLEAVTKSVEARPDVILLDLAMPGKDGLGAAREISQLLPGTPILMCTMHLSAQLETEAQKSGIQKVLSKTESSLILPAIRQLLNPDTSSLQDSALQTAPPPVVDPTPVAASPIPSTQPEADPTDPPASLPKNVA
ncbi:MAG TPA: response regulator transcription factor [Candidatus Sulfotelmatobacter sp.]|nr:response regulator transcription factor [Candidatus Sulfotelmatobacter sp.]